MRCMLTLACGFHTSLCFLLTRQVTQCLAERLHVWLVPSAMNFWAALPRGFFALAPMAGVTDVACRGLVAAACHPGVLFTEFVSVEGLVCHCAAVWHARHPARRDRVRACGQKHARERVSVDLRFDEKIERPIVAQARGVREGGVLD